MKKHILLILIVVPSCILFGQDKNTSYLEFSFGRSQHGTGDTQGYQYGFNYGQAFSKKMYWQVGFEGSLNDTPDFLLTYEDSQGKVYDVSLHTVTAGFQIVSGIKYNIVQSNKHQLGISILPVFRYQATSLSDIYDTLYPAITNLPFPVRNIVRFESGRTFAIGGSFRLQYNYQFASNFYLGIRGAFQTDTNGDAIPSYSVSFGKRFF